MRVSQLGRRLFSLVVIASVVGAYIGSAQVAFGKGGPKDKTPNVLECSRTYWKELGSAPFSHTVQSGNSHITWSGTVELLGLWDSGGFNVYCGQMKATASLTTPVGAASATVQAVLYNGVTRSNPQR